MFELLTGYLRKLSHMRVFHHLFPILWLVRQTIAVELGSGSEICYEGGMVSGMFVKIVDYDSMGLSTIPRSGREDGVLIQVGRNFVGSRRWSSHWMIFPGPFSDAFSDRFSGTFSVARSWSSKRWRRWGGVVDICQGR